MNIFLSPSNQTENIYGYGNTNEAEQCGKIAEYLKAALIRCGFNVMLMHKELMQEKVKAANEWGADYYITIHSNAFNKEVSGTRMFFYTYGGKGHELCKNIAKYLFPLTPGTSENYQQNTTLYETKMPNAYTAYIEIEFHDVPPVAKWIIENTSLIAEAICKGICDQCGVKYKDPEPQKRKLYRIQIGAFENKANAERLLNIVRIDFPSAFIKED